ncbi:MAG: hypothetical protein EA363_05950 [Balneolaceae bacterium]|nr:MAG: hypothetical protein EA363_05950 [Balneolaceae bacterium]
MFNRGFLAVVSLLTISALVLAIYWDSKETAGPGRSAQHPTPDRTANDVPSGRNEAPDSLQPEEKDRIAYVTSVLDTLALQRARLPYYGELIRIYSGAGHYRDAANWGARRARLTGNHADYLHAAELHVAAARQKNEEERIKEEAKKAEEMYIGALKLKPDDPDVLTDLAVVYMSLLQPETSYSMLEQALRVDPDHVRASFNMGVLMHQLGNISESIPFFERSLMLSEDPEWEAVVQGYLDRHHHELSH